MSQLVPQDVLDRLTRVDMPKDVPELTTDETTTIDGLDIPVYRAPALVIGSGAAGLRAAVELKREGIDVVISTTGLFKGTSACSGSDKQTLHTAGTSNNGDNFNKLANDIGSGGCMDADTAYIEATGSVGAFSGLQFMGLPLPQDRFGAVLRYQTDHDEVGRATSCGPRTSRLMVKVLCEEAIRLNIPFLRETTAVRILTEGAGDNRRTAGVIAMSRSKDQNTYGLIAILSERVVLATGGPGELYRDSVYPNNCFGSLGMAIEAGVEVVNLTESQFGIGTRRTEFPWNLSGTYVQVVPYIYSVDSDGNEHNFLADYYRTTQELASNVFRKGYQWPFHATRMEEFGSSLVDAAIFIESQKGHTVLMDFNRNPEAVPGDKPFSLDELDEDVRAYLENNDALQDMPIDRLKRMNPLAIELYRMHGHDIAVDPLPFNVSNQHMNGGIEVDTWAHSSLEGCYAVGEISGTHGVTRPGGAALNAGQVFGMRCAKHIKSVEPQTPSEKMSDSVKAQLTDCVAHLNANHKNKDGLTIEDITDEVQARMSDHAGFICQKDDIAGALNDARKLNDAIREKGINISRPNQMTGLFQWQQTALTSEAVLTALDHYARSGGGSRGARAMCSKDGSVVPETRLGPLEQMRYIPEQDDDKGKKIILQYADGEFHLSERPLREMEDPGTIFFEKNWSHYLTDTIYQDSFTDK